MPKTIKPISDRTLKAWLHDHQLHKRVKELAAERGYTDVADAPLEVRQAIASDVKKPIEWVNSALARKPSRSKTVGGVDGLTLEVRGGSTTWSLTATVQGRRREFGLGAYPAVSLSAARVAANEKRREISQGRDPLADRDAKRAAAKKAKAHTVMEVAETYIADMESGWSQSFAAGWRYALKNHISIIGSMPITDVDNAAIRRVLLHPVRGGGTYWQTFPKSAELCRQKLEALMSAAIRAGEYSQLNPARWKDNLKGTLQAPEKLQPTRNYPAIPYQDMPVLITELRNIVSVSARALEFQILTVARPHMAACARRDQIDLDRALWTIPADKMKKRREYVIPLSTAAVRLLRAMPVISGCPYVFPSPQNSGESIASAAPNEVMTFLRRDATAHGNRTAFRTWGDEQTSYKDELLELCLAHARGTKSKRAYARSQMIEQRRPIMEDWGRYCDGHVATVTRLHAVGE